MPTFETERLILRNFTEDDAIPFLRMISEPEVVKYTGRDVDPETSIEETIRLMNIAPIGDYKKHGYGRHAMVYKETNEVIGFTGLKYMPELDKTDLGYRMFPEYWGKGIATESCKPMLSYGFEILNLDEIIGIAMPNNQASCNILKKVGMDYIDDRDCFDGIVSYFELSRDKYLSGKAD